MKALSMTQPWASLVIGGPTKFEPPKQVETRSWKTPYRGLLAIHAAKGFKSEERDLCSTYPFKDALFKLGYHMVGQLSLGMVLGTVELVGCYSIEAYTTTPLPHGHAIEGVGFMPPRHQTYEYQFGNYGPGRFAWVFKNVHRFDEPIPARGALSLWDWNQP